ncbi:MAG: hypothetical protein ACE14W_02310 [Candidatus Velamenicoccus archaeovorus]
MDELEESVRRCVQAAYEAWAGPPAPLGPPSGAVRSPRPSSTAPVPALRPIRFVSWEELDRVAETALDLDAQVRRELDRTLGGGQPPRSSRFRRTTARRVA